LNHHCGEELAWWSSFELFTTLGLDRLLKVESILAEDNYDLIKESNYFEQLELDKD
jgi:hypothetical protein